MLRLPTLSLVLAGILAGRALAETPGVDDRSLASAPKLERQTLDRLLNDGSWIRRAVAAMRLERFSCAESREILETLSDDEAWQVRAFAVRTLGRRRVEIPVEAFDDEPQPRVLRAALRHRYDVDVERLGRGVRYLARSSSLEDRMLAVELGIASGDPDLEELAEETARKIILRMGRAEAGALSPRLAAVTGQPDVRRLYLWQKWVRESGRRYGLVPAFSIPATDEEPLPPSALAALPYESFASLEGYIAELSDRSVDLAIVLDCTASMSGALAQAQGGIDDLMVFAGEVVDSLRVALVAYRDRRDEFETRAWDFTPDILVARRNLWSLNAAGGGDQPEAVYDALRLAYGQLAWRAGSTGVVVLVGDAPPHIGYGSLSVQMAQRTAALGLTTHVIEADTRGVKHFPEIAEAGGGRCVSLGGPESDSLIVEIAGMTLGGRFREPMVEFFKTYLELCR